MGRAETRTLLSPERSLDVNAHCVIWCVLCAEWLHSSVHGVPGKPPGGGAVPSGAQRQPEYGHRGTVCVCLIVCGCVPVLCPPSCTVSHVWTFTSVVLTTFISSPLSPPLRSASARLSPLASVSLRPFCLTFPPPPPPLPAPFLLSPSLLISS